MDENPGSKFSLNPVTGEILVVGSLDREEQDEYLLKVVARDGSWRADTNVGINIQDENVNAPVFDQEVSARDRDGPWHNSNLKYRLRESQEYFSIHSSSGEIISKKRLFHLKTT